MFLLDILYKDKKIINLIISHQSHALIKTEETRLKDADGLLTHWGDHSGVEHIKDRHANPFDSFSALCYN